MKPRTTMGTSLASGCHSSETCCSVPTTSGCSGPGLVTSDGSAQPPRAAAIKTRAAAPTLSLYRSSGRPRVGWGARATSAASWLGRTTDRAIRRLGDSGSGKRSGSLGGAGGGSARAGLVTPDGAELHVVAVLANALLALRTGAHRTLLLVEVLVTDAVL